MTSARRCAKSSRRSRYSCGQFTLSDTTWLALYIIIYCIILYCIISYNIMLYQIKLNYIILYYIILYYIIWYYIISYCSILHIILYHIILYYIIYYYVIYIMYIYIYEQSRKPYIGFTERTSTNLGRSHRLPHVCTIMICGKLGGYRLQETATFIYL